MVKKKKKLKLKTDKLRNVGKRSGESVESVLRIKVKFSNTRYPALGPELIPVYRQSARR